MTGVRDQIYEQCVAFATLRRSRGLKDIRPRMLVISEDHVQQLIRECSDEDVDRSFVERLKEMLETGESCSLLGLDFTLGTGLAVC